MYASAERRKGEKMKIKVTEHITEIEADARELRESNTLAGNFASLLSRCFQSHEPFDDDYDDEEGSEDDGHDKQTGGD